MDPGCEAAVEATAGEISVQVQALMEQYLRLKEMEPGTRRVPTTVGVGGGDEETERQRDSDHQSLGASVAVSPLEEIRQQVVSGMAPLVEAIARRYTGSGEGGGSPESLDDLVSEGYVGLLAAIDQYRPDRGARFSTYATHRIHGQIRHYLRDRGSRRLIRVPSWLQELAVRLSKEEARIEAELGRPATDAELAERLNLREEAVEELRANGQCPLVLSLTEGGDDEDHPGGVDASKIRSQHYVSWQLPIEDHIFLEGMMVRLKDLERKVITLFFFQEFSQSEIARSMNISCNYVGYLLDNGLQRLRKLIETDELRDAHLQVRYAPRQMADEPGVIDAATGLYNAAYFRARLTEELARAHRYQRELALILVRVPLPAQGEASPAGADAEPGRRREPVRAKAGRKSRSAARAAGGAPSGGSPFTGAPVDREHLYRELGIALRECLRKADIPARLEEGTLAILLPQTGEGAMAAAERITRLLSEVAGGPVRGGVALYPIDGRDPAVLLETARGHAERNGPCREEPLASLPAESLAASLPLTAAGST